MILTGGPAFLQTLHLERLGSPSWRLGVKTGGWALVFVGIAFVLQIVLIFRRLPVPGLAWAGP